MRIARLAALVLSIAHFAFAQHRFDPVARSAGGVWLRDGGDPWCVLGAAPLLSFVSAGSAGLAHYPAPWGIAELAGSAAVIAVPAGPAVFGAAMTRSGFELFDETEFGVAFGASAGAIRYGLTVRYRLLRIERYGSAGIASVDAAVVISTGDWLRWGLRITDLNRPPVGNSGERVRETAGLAASVSFPGAPLLLFEAERDALGRFSTKAGVVQSMGDLLAARFGMSASFTRLHFGIEVNPGTIEVGYGVVVHPDLGWSHSAWVAVDISRWTGR